MTHRPSLTARVPASLLVAALACGGLWSAVQAQGEAAPRAHVTKNGVDVDLRSLGRQVADALAESGTLVGFGEVSPDPSETVAPGSSCAVSTPRAMTGAWTTCRCSLGSGPSWNSRKVRPPSPPPAAGW